MNRILSIYGNPGLDRSVFKKLTIRYLIGLTAIALTIIFSETLVKRNLKEQLYDSRVINVAGRQRMLSQKIAKTVLLIERTKDQHQRLVWRDRLAETLTLWDAFHHGLRQGSDSLGLPKWKSAVIDSMYLKMEDDYHRMYTNVLHVMVLATDTVPQLSQRVDSVLACEPLFLTGMDGIVFQYDKEAKAKVGKLIKTELLLLALSLFILLCELLFIFAPVTLYVRTIIAGLMTQEKLKTSFILEGEETERRRISREIHDGIGQLLTGLKFQLESVDCLGSVKDVAKMENLRKLTAEIIREVRKVSSNITPGNLTDFGLVAALQALVRVMSGFSNSKIRLENLTNFNDRLENEVEINSFRIVQEALNNALKYSQAENILVSLTHEKNKLVIRIEDNGTGFNVKDILAKNSDRMEGHGIMNMKDRAGFIHARLDITSAAGTGTSIVLEIPLE
jgi:signal transduction histidine kinase